MADETTESSKSKTSEIMTENVKTLRVLHQLLMVVASAILVFALRVDLSKDYKAALEELSALKEISFDSWIPFVRERYKDFISKRDSVSPFLELTTRNPSNLRAADSSSRKSP